MDLRDKISHTAKEDEALLAQGEEDDKGMRNFIRKDMIWGF